MTDAERDTLSDRCRTLRNAGYKWSDVARLLGISRYAARRAAVGCSKYLGPVLPPTDPERERRIRIYTMRVELGLPLFAGRRV